MTTSEFIEMLTEVEAEVGVLPVVIVSDDDRTGYSMVQELDASAVEINGRRVFAFIMSGIDARGSTLQ